MAEPTPTPIRPPTPPARGLDLVEKLLFLFGVLGFALLMLLFGEPFGEGGDLPVVALWVVAGVGFIWWFDRHMAHRRH